MSLMKPGTINNRAATNIKAPPRTSRPGIAASARCFLHAPDHGETLEAKQDDPGDCARQNEQQRHRQADFAADDDEAGNLGKGQSKNDQGN